MTTTNPDRIETADLKLPPSMTFEQVDGKTFVLTINRKSRIIMKDGRRLLEKMRPVRDKIPNVRIEIRATAPMCSKTEQFLKDEGFVVMPAHHSCESSAG